MNPSTDRLLLVQSQRDCVLQPRVARNELPWVSSRTVFNPNGVVSCFERRATTPLGLTVSSTHPRVARSSQPWAVRRNPFGIRPGNSSILFLLTTP